MAKATDNISHYRVVLDTNVRVSAIQFNGLPRTLADRLQAPDCIEIISTLLLAELTRILEHKFRKSLSFVTAEVDRLLASSLLVTPTQTIQACRDPDDNHILECALAGQADYIVTGDKDLLTLHPFQQIPILTPRQFLEHIQPPSHLE